MTSYLEDLSHAGGAVIGGVPNSREVVTHGVLVVARTGIHRHVTMIVRSLHRVSQFTCTADRSTQ